VTDIADDAQAMADFSVQMGVLAVGRELAGAGSDICVDCEEPIPEARRRAVPHCRRCIECQRSFEAGGE
jgi:phage/conjugal plasmid C-4 type zinc finger TraR family protein